MALPIDLIVPASETVVLDEKPTNPYAGSRVEYKIDTLDDLVKIGAVSSQDNLKKLLSAAKEATRMALNTRETFTPRVTIPGGLDRADLRRFGTFLAKTGGEKDPEKAIFWRVIRSVEPKKIESLLTSTRLPTVVLITGFLFKDITVQPNATLLISVSAQQSQVLQANNILIKKTGKIKTLGGSLVIKAFSIKGEQ